jgi:hypothetical protein
MSGVPCADRQLGAHVPPAGGTGRSFFKTERTVNASLARDAVRNNQLTNLLARA